MLSEVVRAGPTALLLRGAEMIARHIMRRFPHVSSGKQFCGRAEGTTCASPTFSLALRRANAQAASAHP